MVCARPRRPRSAQAASRAACAVRLRCAVECSGLWVSVRSKKHAWLLFMLTLSDIARAGDGTGTGESGETRDAGFSLTLCVVSCLDIPISRPVFYGFPSRFSFTSLGCVTDSSFFKDEDLHMYLRILRRFSFSCRSQIVTALLQLSPHTNSTATATDSARLSVACAHCSGA